MNVATISRRIEFDAGHRVPGHQGACRRPHGHRYRVEATVSGEVPADGMVIDFGVLKQVLVAASHDRYDHRFLIAEEDRTLRRALEEVCPEGVVLVAGPPTAENNARWIGEEMVDELADAGIRLLAVQVWETPNCSATWLRA